MAEDDRTIRQKTLRRKGEQERTARRLFAEARRLGGYAMLHVPLPFKVPLTDGFLYGWEPDEPRFIELVHYPEPGPEHDYRVRFGEPVFEPEDGPGGVIGQTLLYTVARLGTAVPWEGLGTDRSWSDAAESGSPPSTPTSGVAAGNPNPWHLLALRGRPRSFSSSDRRSRTKPLRVRGTGRVSYAGPRSVARASIAYRRLPDQCPGVCSGSRVPSSARSESQAASCSAA